MYYLFFINYQGYLKGKAFIATQGPLPDTTDDFWRMVWEHKCASIIMLANEREGSKVSVVLCTSSLTSSLTSSFSLPYSFPHFSHFLSSSIPLQAMCHKYWPDSGTQMYGAFEVTMLPVKEYPDYTLREFKIVDSRVCLHISSFCPSICQMFHPFIYPFVHFRMSKEVANMLNSSNILAGQVKVFLIQPWVYQM